MSRIGPNGASQPVDAFALAELFATDAHDSAVSARGLRDSAFEQESALREKAVQEREAAANWELGSGLIGAATKVASGAVGLVTSPSAEMKSQPFQAEMKSVGSKQDVIMGGGDVAKSIATHFQHGRESAAAQLDNAARATQKLGEDLRDAGAELRRIREGKVEQLKQLIDEEARTRQQIIRG